MKILVHVHQTLIAQKVKTFMFDRSDNRHLLTAAGGTRSSKQESVTRK